MTKSDGATKLQGLAHLNEGVRILRPDLTLREQINLVGKIIEICATTEHVDIISGDCPASGRALVGRE